MKKIFVLDTNVLLHDPRAIFSFEDNDVTIPIVVIEELDKFKKGIDEMGRNARQVSRILDEYRQKGKLSQGVQLDGGGSLRVELNHQSHGAPAERTHRDQGRQPDPRHGAEPEARQPAGDPRDQGHEPPHQGRRPRACGPRTTSRTRSRSTNCIPARRSSWSSRARSTSSMRRASSRRLPIPSPFRTSSCCSRTAPTRRRPRLPRYQQQKNAFVPITNTKHGVWGINAKNKQQQFALDLLLNDDIRLVTLVGKAGTGKTLLALAAGLEKTIEARTFQRLVVSRPVFPLGKDIGFLPGDIEEKLRPWMQPIRDNLDFLMGASAVAGRAKGKKDLQSLFDLGMIEVEPLTYIRGRSMPNQYLIVDEAQNLTPHEIKTIITRAGEGTKVVLTGDPYQIDNPYIDSSSNGLTFVVDRFKEEPIAGHITLVKGERSDLAELAATLL